MTANFPRQQARTRGFRLGAPSAFSVSPDGQRIIFVRSPSGTDPANQLVVLDLRQEPPAEYIAADPVLLLGGESEQLSNAERVRRERLRQSAAGVTSYSTNKAATAASFALSGQLGLASLTNSVCALHDVGCAVVDPRLSPSGNHVAWVADRSMYAARVDPRTLAIDDIHTLVCPDSDTVTWGMANFIAAEEFDRVRGHWWSPDGTCLIVERFDEAPIEQWWISDPSQPDVAPASSRYPAAGTANPEVSLWLVNLAGDTTEIGWNSSAFEYVVSVEWSEYGKPLVTVLNRRQNQLLVLAVDVASGTTNLVAEIRDPAWVELPSGVPTWSPEGRLITTVDDPDNQTCRVTVDGIPITPADLNVRAVLNVADDGLLLSVTDEPTQSHVAHVTYSGALTVLTSGKGWNIARRGGDSLLLISTRLDLLDTQRHVLGWSPSSGSPSKLASISSFAETPVVVPRLQLVSLGDRQLRTVVQWPTDHILGSRKLPVIMNPYGGPHAQRVVAAGSAFCQTQWLADQGFCVIVADGRGSPGRGPAWEREVFGDLATAPLDDQVAVIQAAAERWPHDIDATRVAITGWSFGGYLAALAVLARPDVFHAGVAGAPVTDWRLYDTAYTERYLGHPDEKPENYDATSLIPLAANLTRPLLLIHGMADDNVVVAHSLRLSGALVAAGRPHSMLPLTQVTHLTSREDIAENLLLLEVDFLRRALG